MNGKISKRVIGAFNSVKKYGYKKFISKSLKKEISSRRLKIIIKEKKIIVIYKNLTKKLLIKYFW
jgi:nickel-dependent lactate racemase